MRNIKVFVWGQLLYLLPDGKSEKTQREPLKVSYMMLETVDVVLFDHLQDGWDRDSDDLSCCSHKPAQLLYEQKIHQKQ